MVNASKKAGLGNTLNRAQKSANQKRNPRQSKRHNVDTTPSQDNAKLNLKSVTAQTNLDEFFEEAELAGKQFVTERRNLVLVNEEDEEQIHLYDETERHIEQLEEEFDASSPLSVPRRPKWTSSTTPEQLDELERLSFLAWRRKLAKIQESDGVYLTPFEKNLEVWRQLWRVIERSHIVVQILDSRNPLLYLCEDLIKYVNEEFEGRKMNLVLLNKADYLSKRQREFWAEYFRERKIKFMFFSALIENSKSCSSETQEISNQKSVDMGSDKPDQLLAAQVERNLNIEENSQTDVNEEARIYNKFELLDKWRDLLITNCDISPIQNEIISEYEPTSACQKTYPLTVGLVGYPNVGKSSTINALLSAKRVAVSATPGKTKHFQTLLVDKDMMLCDCPGLVFPNFVSSKSEMVINGVLPIDQMKDSLGPVRIIVSRVPKSYFEEIYGLAFEQSSEQNLIAEDLLNALGFMRGYMTARGLPDISRAARKVCKDYINGKILYCENPPDVDKKLYQSHSKLAEALKRIQDKANEPDASLKITERQRRLMRQALGTAISSSEFDDQFFNQKSTGAHIKGLPGIGDMSKPIGKCLEVKGPKHEKKHKKREKLRRVYRHLDI